MLHESVLWVSYETFDGQPRRTRYLVQFESSVRYGVQIFEKGSETPNKKRCKQRRMLVDSDVEQTDFLRRMLRYFERYLRATKIECRLENKPSWWKP